MQWAPTSRGLLTTLAATMARAGVARITCVGADADALDPPDEFDALEPRVELRGLSLPAKLGFDGLVSFLRDQVQVADARAIIVLPRRDVGEPDSLSRLTCAAIRKACGSRPGPNVLVEIEDPEAAFEFVGLGVATVFYSGHLRAALLGQACVDLGVFQFIIGLLRGRHQVRTIEIPEHLRAKTFADAAVELELDEVGRPMTVIGVAKAASEAGTDSVVVNPGPRTPLRDALGLLALVSGEPEPEPASASESASESGL